MVFNLGNFLEKLSPTIVKEELALDTRTSLEKLFYGIISLISRLGRVHFESNSGSKFFHFFRDLIFITLILEMITQIFFGIPLLFVPNDPSSTIFSIEIMIITLFYSISWTGFVYLNDSFRSLVRTRIYPVIIEEKYPETSGFITFLRGFFNGTLLRLQSGFSFRIYLRSIFFLFLLVPSSALMVFVFQKNIPQLLQNPGLAIIFLLTFFLVFFFIYLIIFILLTIILIFFYLFMVATALEIKINPLIDTGGLQNFGQMILDSLFLVSFGLATIPIFTLLTKVRTVPTIQLGNYANQSLVNESIVIIEGVQKSASEMTIGSIYQFSPVILFFLLFVCIALLLILLFHLRIAQKKKEELAKIETLFQDINFYDTGDKVTFETNQYLLGLYEKISNSYEWPIKKIFILELLLTLVPLLISHFI